MKKAELPLVAGQVGPTFGVEIMIQSPRAAPPRTSHRTCGEMSPTSGSSEDSHQEHWHTWLNSVARDYNFWVPDSKARQQQVAVDVDLCRTGTTKPSYGPQLPQVEARFHVDRLMRYKANLHTVTSDNKREDKIGIMQVPWHYDRGSTQTSYCDARG